MKKLFVVISDNGLLRAGNTTRQSLDKLEAKKKKASYRLMQKPFNP